jgi:hypothetical protein
MFVPGPVRLITHHVGWLLEQLCDVVICVAHLTRTPTKPT